MTDLLIRGADLVGRGRSDLLIRDGRFVDPGDAGADVDEVDADGLIALPGLVDLHTHLREPGREDAETVQSGTLAAARGGFTAVLAMANTTPVTDTAEAAEHVAALGARDGHAQVVPVGAVSKGLDGVELAELGLMARSSARVRVFSDDGHCVSDARLMRRALEYVRSMRRIRSLPASRHAAMRVRYPANSDCQDGRRRPRPVWLLGTCRSRSSPDPGCTFAMCPAPRPST